MYLVKPKSGAPQLLFNRISACGFRMNVITSQTRHPFRLDYTMFYNLVHMCKTI